MLNPGDIHTWLLQVVSSLTLFLVVPSTHLPVASTTLSVYPFRPKFPRRALASQSSASSLFITALEGVTYLNSYLGTASHLRQLPLILPYPTLTITNRPHLQISATLKEQDPHRPAIIISLVGIFLPVLGLAKPSIIFRAFHHTNRQPTSILSRSMLDEAFARPFPASATAKFERTCPE